MIQMTKKQEAAFHEIIEAHSPDVLQGKLNHGVKMVQRGAEVGGEEGMKTLNDGVVVLNQVIARHELFKQAERRAEVLHGE